jgi:anti-sigma factor RsiW
VSDELQARVDRLEKENAELRAAIAQRDRPSRQLELVTREDRRRGKVARLMFAGGGVAILAGVFGGHWFAIICGLGWLFGGAAVASTIPESGGDS